MTKEITFEKNIDNFDHDARELSGYVYTGKDKLSSVISNEHITDVILSLMSFRGKDVIDIGCGDGTYTIDIMRLGKPRSILGFDPSSEAIKVARRKTRGLKKIKFATANIYTYSTTKKFDIAVVRGVLHHLYQPEKEIRQIRKLARKVIIAEPNGYNPVLKVIEKTSRYHREHEEKSYLPYALDYWIKKNGGTIKRKRFAGIVPFFCPDWLAHLLRSVENFVEHTPILNWLLCGSYYVVYNNN